MISKFFLASVFQTSVYPLQVTRFVLWLNITERVHVICDSSGWWRVGDSKRASSSSVCREITVC